MTNPSLPYNTHVRKSVQVDVGPKLTDVGDPPSSEGDCVETEVLAISQLKASPR